MNPKLKTLLFFLVGAFAGITMMYLVNNYKIEKRNQYAQEKAQNSNQDLAKTTNEVAATRSESTTNSDIESLTEEQKVVDYVKANHKLPDYYITKSEAKQNGWVASKGNLCNALPGKAIGGDNFSNREKTLPKGDQYYEADVNYNCGNRGADRIVFTKNGDVWLTKDHYKSFDKQ